MTQPIVEQKAYKRKIGFLRLWRQGLRNTDEIALRLGCTSRTVSRDLRDLRAKDPKDPTKSKLEASLARMNPEWADEVGEPAVEGEHELPPRVWLPPDPGPDWDHMAMVRSVAASERADLRDRLKAAEGLEKRRQFDILHGTTKGKVNWALLELDDIPVDERARVFGMLAETMREARAPFLGLPGTTEAQQAVFFALGLQVHADDAEAVLAELAPARAAAMDRAVELTAARSGPPPDITPVDPADYLEIGPGPGGGT